MQHSKSSISDFGTGQKKLSIYIMGLFICVLLTLIAFWVVMFGNYSQFTSFIIIFSTACLQFFVQLICFLRLNTNTLQGQINIMTLIFTGVILISIVGGSLWIMFALNYNMMH